MSFQYADSFRLRDSVFYPESMIHPRGSNFPTCMAYVLESILGTF